MPKKVQKKTAKKIAKKAPAKVVALHEKNEDENVEKKTVLQQASIAEKHDDLESAEQLYKKQLEQKSFNAAVYTRLMIVYRKQKKYKEEVALIKQGLKHYKAYQTEKTTAKKSSSAIKRLSASLNKSLGLTDKKGNALYEPEPIPTWKKRLATVEKKLKK